MDTDSLHLQQMISTWKEERARGGGWEARFTLVSVSGITVYISSPAMSSSSYAFVAVPYVVHDL